MCPGNELQGAKGCAAPKQFIRGGIVGSGVGAKAARAHARFRAGSAYLPRREEARSQGEREGRRQDSSARLYPWAGDDGSHQKSSGTNPTTPFCHATDTTTPVSVALPPPAALPFSRPALGAAHAKATPRSNDAGPTPSLPR